MSAPHHPSVDVVIATRDRPAMVREAVAAVVAQDYAGVVRCLVVHDRTDPDAGLAREHPTRPVEVLGNTGTPGLPGARNTGVWSGRAPYVAFCDDDDLWRPDKLTRQVEVLQRERVDTVVTGVRVRYGETAVDRVPTATDLRTEVLARRRVMAAHPSTVLVRRTALHGDIGPFDEAIPGGYGEDYDWMLRAVAVGPVAVVEEALVEVRWGASQFSRRWQTIVEALDYLIDKHPAFRADPRAVGRLHGQQAFAIAAQHRGGSAAAVVRTLRHAPTEPRAYLAAAVALRLVSADRVLDVVNRRGHGI